MARQLGNFVQDLRLPRDFHTELRFRRLYRAHGAEGTLAVLMLWSWVAGNCPTTGRLEKMTREDILDVGNIAPDRKEFIDDLVAYEFLALDEDGTYYLPNWADEQPHAAKAQERREEAQRKAEKSWEIRRKRAEEQKQSSGKAAAKPKQCSNSNTNAFKSPPPPPQGGKEDAVKVVDLYREVLPELPQPNEMTAKLRRDIDRARTASPERAELAWWRERFEQVRQSPHLMGENGDWRASLGWLVTGENLDKLLAGHYPPRAEGGPAKRTTMSEEEFEAMLRDQEAGGAAVHA